MIYSLVQTKQIVILNKEAKMQEEKHSVARRIIEIFLTVLFVTFLSFLLMRLSPIDPATAYAKRHTPSPTAEQIAELRIEMGLNKPLIVQYGAWVGDAFSLDFGESLVNGKDALGEILQVLPFTITVVLVSSILQIIFSVLVSNLMYLGRNNIGGKLLKILMLIFVSIPSFYIANSYLNFFAVETSLISVTDNEGFMRYFHPAICLTIPYVAFYGRLLYTTLAKEMNEDYAYYAQCRGLSESRILLLHATPRACFALLPNFMQSVGLTMAGAAFVERIFSLPGLGYLIIESVMHRDSPVVHLCVLVLALSIAFVGVLADGMQHMLNKKKVRGGVAK